MKLRLIGEALSERPEGHDCTIYGRVVAVRRHKARTFFDISDHTGKVQIVYECNDRGRDICEGSYVSVDGTLEYRMGKPEMISKNVNVIARATLPLNPHPWDVSIRDPRHGNQIFDYPGFYVANPERSSVLKIKANFTDALHCYMRRNNFTFVEPPIITDKTLYDESTAVRANVHGENVFLTQCATFELEPLAMAFGKVYTISPAFRNEKAGSKRHLAEYTHAKAEMLLANMDDLMEFAGDLIYTSIGETLESSGKELDTLEVSVDHGRLDPKKYAVMTYDEAVKFLRSNGSDIEYGRGLSRRDEEMITRHCGDNYVWVQFLPFASEGFPYSRKKGERHLSMTADLIAPHGAGEMVGVAEKTTSADELVENLIEKGKKDNLRDYWQYILLRNYGLPPHGGIGAAPERILYGLLGLDHIRLTKPWPRYPDRKIHQNEMELNPWNDPEVQRIIDKFDIK